MAHSFIVSKRHRDFLADRRIRTSLTDDCRLGDGYVIFLNPDATIEPYSTFLGGSGFCSIGAFSYSWSELFPDAQIGRYCSIAHDVKFMGGWHPMHHVSTSSLFYDRNISSFRDAEKDFGAGLPVRYVDETPHFPIVEHDVWIGQGAIIGRGVTIGTGAVIAAGSVVTRNVEPYSIVGGNPAKHIRYRFEEDIRKAMLASRWWRFALPQFKDMDFSEPFTFLRQLEERQDKMEEFTPEGTTGAELLAL